MKGTHAEVTTISFENQPCKANGFDAKNPIINKQVIYNTGTVAPEGGPFEGYWFTPTWFFGWNRR